MSGLPEIHKENIDIKQNGAVMIKDLSSSECEVLITAIHTKTHFGRRMYCNGIIPRTPDKAEIPDEFPASNPIIPGPLSPLSPSSQSDQIGDIGPLSTNTEKPDVLDIQLSKE